MSQTEGAFGPFPPGIPHHLAIPPYPAAAEPNTFDMQMQNVEMKRNLLRSIGDFQELQAKHLAVLEEFEQLKEDFRTLLMRSKDQSEELAFIQVNCFVLQTLSQNRQSNTLSEHNLTLDYRSDPSRFLISQA